MTIPSPAVLHFRGGPQGRSRKRSIPISTPSTPISARPIARAVKAFYDAGCRYLQFDDTVWAYLCSQDELRKSRERGDNPDGLQEIYARIINYAIAERPADMVITTHVCRGNFRFDLDFPPAVTSRWPRPCWPAPITTASFLEYDSDRAGFEPLRYLPKGNKIVVVGIITSKTGELEKKDDIKRRLEEAARLPRSTSSLSSPQCALPRPRKATS